MASRSSRSSDSCGGLVVAALILALLWGWLSSGISGDAWLGVLVLVGIAVVVVWLVRRLSGPKTQTARELARRFELVRAMSGMQFEAFVADLLRAMGHRATVLGGAGDQGVDVIVSYEGRRVAVQCKNHKRAVGNKPVQEVYAGARYHRCQEAWVVAPSGYTRGARELARSTGVSLFAADTIGRWIRQVDRLEEQRERPEQTPPGATRDVDEEAVREARKRASWHPHPDDPT